MATPSYDYSIDTLVSTTLDAYSGDPINLITKSGEKFLNRLKDKGRIFFIKDCEKIRHPLLIGHGEDSSYYIPDTMSGSPATDNLGTEAQEILTQCNFSMVAGTRNINMPQSMPPGDVINYVDTLVRANLLKIWNEEEQLWWAEATKGLAPFSGDTAYISTTDGAGWSAGYPMNCQGLLIGGTEFSGCTDLSAEVFAGVTVNDVGAEWNPQFLNSGGDPDFDASTRVTLVQDLQSVIDSCGFSEAEHCTDVFTTKAVYEGLLTYLRENGALPAPIQANMGASWDHSFDFGGVKVHWSRYLSNDADWDKPGSTTACDPVLGLNLNSLRMNVVAKPNTIDGQLGFIHQVGSTIPHAALTNVFKRIAWKRNFSVDNGRRSCFYMSGVND